MEIPEPGWTKKEKQLAQKTAESREVSLNATLEADLQLTELWAAGTPHPFNATRHLRAAPGGLGLHQDHALRKDQFAGNRTFLFF